MAAGPSMTEAIRSGSGRPSARRCRHARGGSALGRRVRSDGSDHPVLVLVHGVGRHVL